MIDPGTATLISTGVNALGAGLGFGEQEQQAGNLHLVNPQQQLLYNKMLQGLMGGGGDFGYGSNVKAGTSQLQNMMAQRGVKVGTGGAYSGAYGNMVGNALGQDAQARRQYAMGLLQSPLQTATVSGANLIPGSTSAGYSGGAQEGTWNQYQQTGFVPPGVGGQPINVGQRDAQIAQQNQQNQQSASLSPYQRSMYARLRGGA